MFFVMDNDGKGGGVVVNTTDLCTLNLIATQAHNLGYEFRSKVKIGIRNVC